MSESYIEMQRVTGDCGPENIEVYLNGDKVSCFYFMGHPNPGVEQRGYAGIYKLNDKGQKYAEFEEDGEQYVQREFVRGLVRWEYRVEE